MSDRELIDEVMTLVVAGHETTASGLNWTWYLLSQNPEAEARLHAEIDAAPDMPTPKPRADGIARVHAAGRERGVAFVSTGLAALPSHDRGGCARRI
jgi:cytochrome P450